MLTILIFVIILGFLVFVHELGHFLTAKKNGIKTDEFGFGFPPRIAGFVKDDATGKYKILWGGKEYESKNTIYSLNWIPLGGFVRIKGEDGAEAKDPGSFAGKSAWVRIKVLAAGVVMNFVVAWLLLSVVFTLGIAQPIQQSAGGKYKETKIQIVDVRANTPASEMGLQPGDAIVSLNGQAVEKTSQINEIISASKGEAVVFQIDRFGKPFELSGTPRMEYPKGEGAMGFAYSETAIVSYPWYESLYRGLIATYTITLAIFDALGKMIGGLFGGEKVGLDVTGPVGIVYLTKQMSDLGFVYLLQFAALLSINLGIINILPIPALDGGRILFILIEKLKGSPVSKRVEGMIHQVGFIILILLMLLVTARDFAHFDILGRIGSLF